jgi:hypothetical protein
VFLVLLAGCTGAPPSAPVGEGTWPQAEAPKSVILAELHLPRGFDASFPTQAALLLPAQYFEMDREQHRLTSFSPMVLVGQAILKVEGVDDVGWVVMLGPVAKLHGPAALFSLQVGEDKARFQIMMSEQGLRFEQLPSEEADVACRAMITSSERDTTLGGDRFPLFEIPEGGNATWVLSGPGPCNGGTLRFEHLGTWQVGAPARV